MLVRVFDNQSHTYFKSIVYAIINTGRHEKWLVVVPSDDGGYFKFFDFFDKSNPKMPKVLINSIMPNSFCSDFELIHLMAGDITAYNIDEKLEDYTDLSNDIKFYRYSGYSWIYKNKHLLSRLLKGEAVSTKNYENQIIAPNAYQIDGWNYIENQQDIDSILEQTCLFLDSVLTN